MANFSYAECVATQIDVDCLRLGQILAPQMNTACMISSWQRHKFNLAVIVRAYRYTPFTPMHILWWWGDSTLEVTARDVWTAKSKLGVFQ